MFTPHTGETQTGQIMCYKTGHIMCCQQKIIYPLTGAVPLRILTIRLLGRER